MVVRGFGATFLMMLILLVIIHDLEFLNRSCRHRWIRTSLEIVEILLLRQSFWEQFEDTRLRIVIV